MFDKIVNKEEWDEVISWFDNHDMYHTYDYHKAHETIDGGEAVLYVFKSDGYSFALPLLKRDVFGTGFFDLTSVYGYPSPLEKINNEVCCASIVKKFWRYLLEEENCISLFSRMNTFFEKKGGFFEFGEKVGETVNISLLESETVQLSKYRKNHRRDIKKLKKLGFTCDFYNLNDGFSGFFRVYNETMSSLNASSYYFFDEAYYDALFKNDCSEVKLVLCKQDGVLACAGIFSFTGNIVQYHLGGTSQEFYKYAPTKLMFDFVRAFSFEHGFEHFHLGGGLGGNSDNLLNFKIGFSDRTLPFKVMRIVLNEEVYASLSEGKDNTDFFPLYRC
ncbi:GNAT family N-acetyltransferase [Pseudoalteromonas sp. XMcav11-Q]|uniref:GNAT family N-acetyltransferase n=1 Tax=Pseudoalteromonas sp. XMcav11-Q TaxID=3136665 RepID=UPI0032C48316